MDVGELSMMHHVAVVFFGLWLLSFFGITNPVAYFVSLIYLYLVHERLVERLRRRLKFQERKQTNQKRVLSDSETVRWLNYAVEKIWPICMEQIASQKILLPIIPWFLEKYKPWTAKEAKVQHMYLGRNPPWFTEMRVLRHSGDDHLVLELGMDFCTADDMSGILAVKLRKRLGFGIWTKLHITGMHVEGKVLVGIKFLREWPFLGHLRVCFAEPPYFQMTVKPIFTHGLDVTALPGIAGWLDKLLSVAFEQTLVQPNMLVVDMEKFVSPQSENWFSVDVKEPVAYAKVEVVEASDMKPSDLNGLADPYVKGQLGPYRFRTKIQKKTLTPKWHEDFKIPICTWESPNMLSIEVRDKDHLFDDALGMCSVNINDLKDGERHDMWLPLQNIKMGRLHLAVTVLEESVKEEIEKEVDVVFDGERWNKAEKQESFASDTNRGSFSSVSTITERSPRVADHFEPINIEGQDKTGVWIHHPGSEVSQVWEPRKGKSRQLDGQISIPSDSFTNINLTASTSPDNGNSSDDEVVEAQNPSNRVLRGIRKIGLVFHRNHKEDNLSSNGDTDLSPYANIKSVNEKEIGVKFIVEDGLPSSKDAKNNNSGLEGGSGQESPNKGNVKGMAKNILKQARKSVKHALSRKGSRKSQTDSLVVTEQEIDPDLDSSDDESPTSPKDQKILGIPNPSLSGIGNDDTDKTIENVVQASSNEPEMTMEGRVKRMNVGSLEGIDETKVSACHGSIHRTATTGIESGDTKTIDCTLN